MTGSETTTFDSAEAYDRGAKAAPYRRIPSLREHMLVSQRDPLIEVYRRNERGNWELVAAASAPRWPRAASPSPSTPTRSTAIRSPADPGPPPPPDAGLAAVVNALVPDGRPRSTLRH
jgi:hypothetical protein